MSPFRLLSPETAKGQFFRFLVVGVVNTAFGYGCFALLLYLGLHYATALFIATMLGVLFNFKTTGRLVFGSHQNRLIARFIGCYAVVYCINVAGIKFLALLGLPPYAGGAILLLPIAVLSFVLNKRFVFHS